MMGMQIQALESKYLRLGPSQTCCWQLLLVKLSWRGQHTAFSNSEWTVEWDKGLIRYEIEFFRAIMSNRQARTGCAMQIKASPYGSIL